MTGRRRADAITAALPPEVLADSDRLRLWHQQQASQIELDLQQHALTALQLERDLAAADRVHYATLYQQAPAGYLSLDAAGRITRGNQAAAELLGQRHEDLPGLLLERLVSTVARQRLRRFIIALFASGVRGVLELTLAPHPVAAPPGSGRQSHRVRIEANLDTVAQQCRMVLTDLGSSGRRESARQRASLVLDNIGEAVVVGDRAQRIAMVNPAFTRLTGYQAEDVLGRAPGFLVGRGSGASWRAARQALRDHGAWQGEIAGRRRDGERYVAALSLTAVAADDGAACYIGVFSDITARRRAERLAAHQDTLREEERRRLARAIHDELGQNLLALRLDIAQLQLRASAADGPLGRRVDAALDGLDATIRSVRGIMNELRPAVLDLGLCGALEWQVQEFRRHSGLACTLALPPEAQLPPLAAQMELALFRNLQQALLNVRQHARATAVEVALTLADGGLALSIADNGVGLTAASREQADAFGLLAVEQRMRSLGGRLRIDSPAAGRGCRLTLSFDL